MPFGMGPAGRVCVSPYAFPYAGLPYTVRPWWSGWRGGWGRGRGRGFGWQWLASYRYPWW